MDWRVRSFTQLLLLGCLVAIIDCGTAEQRVVCYYTNWSVYRPGTAKFSPQNINPYLCTHLIYAFGGFTKDNALKPFDKYQDIEKGGYAKFTGLKTYNKNLKTMLAIGGWNEASSRFSPMVADPDRRKEFVRNTVKFLRQNHFDGLDLDWEYPAFRDGGKPRDRDNYASLVQELREEYERESSKTGRPRLLLSMAVPAGIEYIEKGYDIPKLNKYLDFINLLSYDYHSSFEPAVNHHSPLYPLEEDNEYNFDSELTVDYTIKYLLESGASADKIVLGIPTYGRSYTLFNEEATDLGSPADGPGEEGDATREKGYLAYYEICESLMNSDEWEIVTPNPNAMGPYAFKGNQWVGYDDENIVRLKAQYVTENGLGGIMFWSIDNDDFRGKCHDRPYPLIEAAKEAMLVGSEKSSAREKLRRPTKTRQGSNYIGRKLGTGRRTTTEASTIIRENNSRKRINSSKLRNRGKPRVSSEEEEEEEEETRVQFNGRNRGQFFNSEEDEDYSNNGKIGTNIVRSLEYGDDNGEESSRPSSGNRVRSGQGRRRKPENSRRRSTTASSIPESIEEEVNIKKVTTPEPPTTPDPGTDFKCEEEGFFSHPKDCKKYFWCLDAGPGGLGIVAHHFTCPAGLVFNKAADSCDYPRNVVCPKTKTVEGPTTRAPIVAATSRTTRIHSTNRRTTTSTTTEPAEYSEEYEYYDDDDDEIVKSDNKDEDSAPLITTTARTLQYKTIQRGRPTTDASTTTTTTVAPTITTEIPPKTVTFRNYQSIPSRTSSISPIASLDEAEEDPKVLKELIELIKKAGGIEELEKQLHLQSKGGESILQTGSVTDAANSTPSTISKSLYERVLNRQAANRGSAFFRRTTPSPVTTTKETAEILDPQPSITQRSRPAFRNGPGRAQFEGLDDLPEVKSLRREKPHYTTINRNRSSSTQPPNENDDELNDGNANEPTVEEKPITDETETTPRTQKDSSGYVDIRRGRTTTARSSVVEEEEEEEKDEESVYTQRRRPAISDNEANDNNDNDDDNEDSKNVQTTTETFVSRRRNQFPSHDETASTTSRYITIQRVRSTTQATTAEKEEEAAEEEEEVEKTTSPKNDEKVIETTTKSSTESTPTTTTEGKIDEKNPISETTVSIEASATEQSVLQTTIAVIQPITTTQSSNFVPTDFPVETVDSIATLLPAITVKTTEEYVTTSAAPLPAIIPIASTDEPNLDEQHVTKGVISTVAQPRPFGFQRRTRPTTTTSATLTPTQETTTTTTTTTTVSSDTGRVKVSSETVRLPTLKELIGYKTIVAHDYTTTTPITLSVKNLLDDDNDINNNDPNKHLAATVTPAFESEKLTPEQVQITNATTSTIADKKITEEVEITDETLSKEHSTLETYGNDKDYVGGIENNGVSEISKESSISTESSIPSTIPIKILKQDRIPSRRRKTKLVRIPVRILESDRPLTDVVLEVPEYKANSILKSLLRVEILKQDDVITSTTTIPKAVNRRNQRTRLRNAYRNRGDLINEKESNELLNRDANTNFISNRNTFTTTTPRVSTIRGSPLSPRSRSRGNRGFYVTKSIASTTPYETMTSTVPSLVTESNNELDKQFSTIPDQLSTLKDNPSTVATTSVTDTSEFYTTQEESTSQDTWHSTITTSLENFNNIMAVNDDVDNPMLVGQKTTTTPSDVVSTVYLSTTGTMENVESTTESASTEYEEDSYSSTSGEEEFASNTTEEYDETYTEATAEPELSTEDSRTTSSVTRISTTVQDLEYFIKVDPPLPAIQKTTIWRKDNSVKEIGASDIGATSFNIHVEADMPEVQKTTVSNYEGTSEAISTVDPDILRTTNNWQSNTLAETSTSRSGSTIFTTGFEVGTETGTTSFQKTTVSDFGDTTEAVNTVTPDISQTTINHNTYSTTDSITSKSETTKLNTEFDSYTETTATPEFQTTSASDSGETTTEINENTYFTTESGTLSSETTKLNTEFNFHTEASTPDFKKTTLPDNSEITTEISETVTPDLRWTTINENSYPTGESSTSKLGATTSNTEFNFYTEVSTPDFQKTTISDIEVTSDDTKFLDSETSTVDFKTEIDSSTETTSVGTTSYFRKPIIDNGSNSEPTTFASYESHQADNFVPQSETTEESTSTTISSSSQANFETTTFLNAQSEASTFDFTAPNTISTISYSSISTQVPSATVADKMQTLNVPIVETEKKETATLSQMESESTSLPSSNAFLETTAASTTTKRDEEVTQKLDTDENETEVRRPLLATRYSDSELVRQGFYRSPSAIPGKKTWRRRVIKKRIYGVRSPHIETVSGNENSTGTVKLNPMAKFNGTNKPGKRFVRRRIINRTTGTFIDETVKGNPRIRVAQNKTLNINTTNQIPEFVQKTTTDLPNERNTLEKKLPKRRRVFYRRRPTNNRTNTRNNSIETNISSQNTSASNDVQSFSVSSTNLSDRRRITLERFRYRGTGLAKRAAISSSPSSQNILATDISQLRSIESAAKDNLPRRNTGGQYLTDVTVDNLASSEIYDTVAIHERRELPQTESISEAQLELEPSLMSEDDQADEGEIKLFKTRPSSPRLPGTLLRQGRPSSSTSIPDNEIVTTISPSTKLSNSVALRRRLRPVQRPATATNNVAATSQPASESGETLKSEGNEAVSESLDQTGHAQEVDVTVAARDSSSPAPSTVTGRPLFRTAIRRRVSSTEAPQVTVPTTVPTIVRQRQRPKPFEKVSANTPTRPRRPAIIDYDYYEDSEDRVIGKPKLSGKIAVSSGGSIRCLDQGNFPHPTSCKKFITCARMVNGQVIGTEYTCPKRLSFDPVGGICNWSAGLGCKE